MRIIKIEITINANHDSELHLCENSDKLKSELLNIIRQFVGKDSYIEYTQEHAQIDAATGEVVNHNPYPIKRHYNYEYDKEHQPLKQETPVVIW